MLRELFQGLGIQAIDSKKFTQLVGSGTDGASALIAGGGLKGLIETKLPWMMWMWCLVHRVGLAVKDALKMTYFHSVNGILLTLFLCYAKSPKSVGS